jgi:adenylate cyclase
MVTLVERRLAAILAADVVGYSRLMEADEAETLAAVKARRRDVFEPLVAKHHGRIFKLTGDGVLVEFPSAVNAVQCAVELQQGMALANESEVEDRQIVMRIGMNLGDVMVDDEDLYGDGINIAARLESLAEPGGILVSGTLHDYVRNKVDVVFEEVEPQDLKNIAKEVRQYRVTGVPRVTAVRSATGKPAIAVLPFDNMSGDPAQRYFSDGITEDIITEISRFHELFVIARNSSFQYQDKAVDVRRVARDLCVQYVLEGSVRKSGERLRITAQLIDAVSAAHLWSNRYDRDVKDVFAVQEEVSHAIATTLVGRIAATGADRSKRKPTAHLAAYDYFLQGREKYVHYDASGAEPLLRRAIDLDPEYAQAFALLSSAIAIQYIHGGNHNLLREALEHARHAVALDESESVAHGVLAHALLHSRQHYLAGVHFERALMLNPNDTFSRVFYAYWHVMVGQAGAALEHLQTVLLRDPYPPSWFWEVHGATLFQLRRYEAAINSFLRISPTVAYNYGWTAACFAMLDQQDQAREQLSRYLKEWPDASISWWSDADPYSDNTSLTHLLDALRKAGLPG